MDRICPPSFLCPISHDLMVDPVICSDGQSYERGSISNWLTSHATSPVTNLELPNLGLVPNHALRNAIQEWLQRTFKTVPQWEDITLGRQIGAGAFKAVFEGTFQGRRVAVLKLRAGSCDTEAAVFVKLGRRPGLVQYIGMCQAGGEQLLLTEFAEHGSLSKFMQDHDDGQISMQHKVVMMHQIASGMEALSAEGLVHRDLAARNVLVFKFSSHDAHATQVKVSDFGLAVGLNLISYVGYISYIRYICYILSVRRGPTHSTRPISLILS